MSRVFSSIDLFVSFTYVSYAFWASDSALIASASSVSVSRMICSSMPMTPPAPEDCLYSLKPGGGRGDVVRLLQERLRLPLVRHGLLEVLVLHLAVLTGALQLRLHLRDLRLQRRDGLRELVDRRREVRDLGFQLRDIARLELRLALVRVQALGAEVLVLDLVRFLLQQRSDHLVNGRLHLRECVEADACRERSQARVAVGLRGLEEERRGLVAVLAVRRLHLRLDEVEGLREGVVRIIARQDGERLAHGLNLLSPGLLALFPLLVRHLARLLQVHE